MYTGGMERRNGFTLVELLVVVAIIGVLATIGLTSFTSAQQRARDARRRGDIQAISKALEEYYLNSSGTYPAAGCAGLTTYFTTGSVPTESRAGWNGYNMTCGTTTYCVCATMEVAGSGNATDGNCTYGAGSNYCVNNQQ